MPIKSVKMKISKNKKMRFFLMSQWSFNPKIRFLGQKVCHVARPQTHTQTHIHTHRHTRKWILRAPFQGFRIFPFNLSSRIGPIPRSKGMSCSPFTGRTDRHADRQSDYWGRPFRVSGFSSSTYHHKSAKYRLFIPSAISTSQSATQPGS